MKILFRGQERWKVEDSHSCPEDGQKKPWDKKGWRGDPLEGLCESSKRALLVTRKHSSPALGIPCPAGGCQRDVCLWPSNVPRVPYRGTWLANSGALVQWPGKTRGELGRILVLELRTTFFTAGSQDTLENGR